MTLTHFLKVFVILVAAHFATANENITDAELIALLGSKNFNNDIQSRDVAAKSDRTIIKGLFGDLYTDEYLLYTRENPTTAQILDSNNRSSIISSNFNPRIQTIVIVHGWLGDAGAGVNTAIRDAYFEVYDVNVIVLDWSRLAAADYVTATIGVPSIGRNLGRFINYLIGVTGATLDNMHLIGFSLGAHVVGNAGKELGGSVARITGLDPAGPLWSANLERLQSTDAVYVEAIHTNRGVIGTLLNVGDTDFYPNGGASQPGCTNDICNHNRAWQLFAASITNNNLIGNRCESDLSLLLKSCYGDSLPLGTATLDKTGPNGIYYLRTGSEKPYN